MVAVQRNQTEVEQAKEHPRPTTTELRTSWSQLQPEMLSVGCHIRHRLTTYLSLFHLGRCGGRLLKLRCAGPLSIEKVTLAIRKRRKRLEEFVIHFTRTVKRMTNHLVISIQVFNSGTLEPWVSRLLKNGTLNRSYLFQGLPFHSSLLKLLLVSR